MRAKGSDLWASALRDAAPTPYWTDRPDRPVAREPLSGVETTDLVVIGGGYSGLWTALLAKERDPHRDVVLVEAGLCGDAASGRNGGFCAASLTHGLANGAERFGAEVARLERLGRQNLDEIEQTIRRYGIECDWERTGELSVAVEPYQVAELRSAAEDALDYGHDVAYLGQDEVQAEVHSPTYLAGLWDRDRVAMVDPAKLAWGLRAAALSAGVRIYEDSPAVKLSRDGSPGAGSGVAVYTPLGVVRAQHAALATNAFPLLRRLRRYLVPVYDYALMTAPLTAGQLESIGWRNRQGLGDLANQFHYYRITPDGRILFGGYDAIYHFGNRISVSLERRTATFEMLAAHFFETFPQLAGSVTFSHAWGGVIDTCTRFCPFFGTAMSGRVAYAAGYTGLGVGATRFGAQVMLDLLSGADSERTRLRFVRTRPIPFPPEPFRSVGIGLTRWSLARADARQGRRNLWLRTLDRAGLGFDS
ncbi:MAG: FAD-dependent oxidoreductase [Hamadaea sp.]|nr:FAD-dependent oxidoreductase [Hamadaea sp.]